MFCQANVFVSAEVKLPEEGAEFIPEKSGYCEQIDCHTRFAEFWFAFRKISVSPVSPVTGRGRVAAAQVCSCSRCGNARFWGRVYSSHFWPCPRLLKPVNGADRRGEAWSGKGKSGVSFSILSRGGLGFALFPVRRWSPSPVPGPGCRAAILSLPLCQERAKWRSSCCLKLRFSGSQTLSGTNF